MQRRGQVGEPRRFVVRLQAQRDRDAHVGEIVTVAQVGRVVGPGAAGATFRLSPRSPTLVPGAEMRGLEIGQAQPRMGFPVDTCGENQTVLQPLMLLPFGPPPAQRIGEQPGQHGRCGKPADDAVVVYRFAAEGYERRFQVQDEVSHASFASPLRIDSCAHFAKSSKQTRLASGMS